jgi:DNA end-binding protein Ku
VKSEEVSLAKRVMGGFESEIDFSSYHDSYEEALRKMIDAKIEGEEIIATPEARQSDEDVFSQTRIVNTFVAARS